MTPRSREVRHRTLRAVAAVLVLAASSMTVAAGAPAATSSPTPWDGANPFRCTIQDAGFGTKVPHPGADPYCVHFDKTHQNVTQLGLIDFLSKEPARVAAATPKCFYFQEDHWRGSVLQSDGRTVIYEFVGHYFFDKAKADGGAWVSGFSAGGHTFDPTQMPGFPPTYGRYFGPGTGGFITHDGIPADPNCAARAAKRPASIYAATANRRRCAAAAGHVDRSGVGPLTLGMTERQVRRQLGPPGSVRRGFLRFCVTRGGALMVGEPGDRSGGLGSDPDARVVILLTSAPGYVSRGSAGRWRRIGSVNGLTVLRSGNLLTLRSRQGRAAYRGCYGPRSIRTRSALLGYLRRAT